MATYEPSVTPPPCQKHRASKQKVPVATRFTEERPRVLQFPRATPHHKQGAVAVMRLHPASLRMDLLSGTPTQQKSRSSNHIQRKLSTIAKTTVLSAKSLKTPALKGQGRHRLTWRRLCLPCQASAIYEFDLNQDLWWHFAPEQSPTP